MEAWADIQFYEGYYQISSLGRIKTLSRNVSCKGGGTRNIKERIIYPSMGAYYLLVNLKKGTTSKTINIHRLVALAFIPNPDNKSTVNHIDGNKLNNAAENLEWATPSENNSHAFRIGLKTLKGENHNNVKLTQDKVREIMSLKGKLPQSEIAKMYMVSRSCISSVHCGNSWNY